MRVGLIASAALVAAGCGVEDVRADEAPPADSKEPKACQSFAWPLTRERDWFADPNLVHRDSGERLRRIDRAVELKLLPTDQVEFFLPPVHPVRRGGYSGEVTFLGVPRVGRYEVTVSGPANVDVFENGTRIPILATTQTPDCPGLYGSVRFDLAPGDLVLVEISNAAKPMIRVAFAEAP